MSVHIITNFIISIYHHCFFFNENVAKVHLSEFMLYLYTKGVCGYTQSISTAILSAFLPWRLKQAFYALLTGKINCVLLWFPLIPIALLWER